MRSRKPAAWPAALLLVLAAAAGRSAVAGAERPILIRGAHVLPVSGDPLPGGSVLIREGKIAAVGMDLAAPEGAEILEARGAYLMPGIIDCHSHIAIAGGVNEGTLSVTAMVGIEDVVDPDDINIYRDLAGGVTTANLLHGSANAIGGRNQVIKLRWGQDAEGLKFKGAPPGIKFALGENPKRGGNPTTPGRAARYPATRMGVEDVIRDAFNRARAYQADWDDFQRKKAQGRPAIPPRRSLELETLSEVLQGKRKVHCHCYRADEILMMLRLAEEFGFRVATFQHVLEGYKVAKELAAHGAGASTFSDWWAFKIEAWDAIPYNAAIMTKKGVVVSINSDSAEEARHLNQEAAKCVRYGGLTETEALRLVTLNPAKQLGIDRWVGLIEPGKDADLVLYDRHPLDSRAMAQKVWIDGRLYFDRERDRERQKKDEEEKARLLARERSGGPRGGGNRPAAEAPPAPPPAVVPPPIPSASPAAPAPAGPVYAIRGARIYRVSGPIVESGTVVWSGDRILAVGPEVEVPRGARVIDGKGLRVYPGMIDARTQIGLTEISSITETEDTTELGDYKPHLQAYDAFNAGSEHIPVTRVVGITTALSLPSGGVLSGQAVLANLDGWTIEEMAVLKNAGIAATLPSPGGGRTFGRRGRPEPSETASDTRSQYEQRVKALNELLDQARHYRAAKTAAQNGPEAPRRDEKLEALIPLLDGAVPLLADAGSEEAIRAAVAFAARQKLRLVILGGQEAWKVTDLLKQHDVPVLYGPVQRLPGGEDEPYDRAYAVPGMLAKAGVRFAIVSNSVSNARNLPFEAGTAAGNGLSDEDALKAVTLYPAQILGVADRLGSIEPGKIANLVVTDGDLLEIRTQVKQLFIAGKPVSLETKHTRLWEKYRDRP